MRMTNDRFGISGGPLYQFRPSPYDHQEIVEVMGHATCEYTDGLHFLGLQELTLQQVLLP